MKKQEAFEEAKDLNYWKNNAEEDYVKVPISVLRYISEFENKQKRSFSDEEVRKALLVIKLVNPTHLIMLRNGYGEFPDSYELTEKGVDYIIEQFKKK